MVFDVGVVGASGYGGAELLRLLDGHSELQVAVAAAHQQAGTPVEDLFPNLRGVGTLTAVDPAALADLDLVFLATPHGAAAELADDLVDRGTRVVDLSAAYRLSASEFATWYGESHPRPERLPAERADSSGDAHGGNRAVYGLTEYAREEIREADLVANPGCYVITALLGLLPLSPLVDVGSVVIDGKSGTSGAGRATRDSLHVSHVSGSITAYGVPGHRHTGEIERYLAVHGADVGPVSFTPHLVPMPRGLLITAYAQLADGYVADDVQTALQDAYRDEAFVRVLEPGDFPVTKAVAGSNGCQISAVVDQRTSRVVVTSVTDNLGKGAAGSAIQNANVMLAIDESTGLSAVGVYP